MENLKQGLLELIADWLDDVHYELKENNINDHEDLHIDISDAAFKVLESNKSK